MKKCQLALTATVHSWLTTGDALSMGKSPKMSLKTNQTLKSLLYPPSYLHQPTTLRTNLQSTSILIKLNNFEILISVVYKTPNQILDPTELDILIQSSDWSISIGNFNRKHHLWHYRIINITGLTLYSHS